MSDRILLNLMSMGTKGEKHMPRISRILIPFLVVCLVCLSVAFAAFAPRSHANAQSSTTRSAAHPAITTNCPAPGTATAASMPPLTLGSHPNIVYIVNESTPFQGSLKRYDIVTGGKVQIVKLANRTSYDAKVSAKAKR